MQIEFDPAKDAQNIAKHGVSLRMAESLDWERTIEAVDGRHEREVRNVAIGPIGERLYVLIYTMRGERLRAISLRKANLREFNRYAQKVDSAD